MIDYSGNKPGDLFVSIDAAARNAAIYIGSLSFINGWEYAASIYAVREHHYVTRTIKKPAHNGVHLPEVSRTVTVKITVVRYTYSISTIRTDNDPMSVGIPRAPDGHTRVAAVHTHPRGSEKGITQFSDTDINNTDKIYKCLFYVYGPNGEMRRYDPVTKKDILLFDDLPISTKQPWLD